jgi:hypothetical protein
MSRSKQGPVFQDWEPMVIRKPKNASQNKQAPKNPQPGETEVQKKGTFEVNSQMKKISSSVYCLGFRIFTVKFVVVSLNVCIFSREIQNFYQFSQPNSSTFLYGPHWILSILLLNYMTYFLCSQSFFVYFGATWRSLTILDLNSECWKKRATSHSKS